MCTSCFRFVREHDGSMGEEEGVPKDRGIGARVAGRSEERKKKEAGSKGLGRGAMGKKVEAARLFGIATWKHVFDCLCFSCELISLSQFL